MGLQQRTESDELPKRIVVRDCAMKFDGGTIYLDATDEAGRQVSILLATPIGWSELAAGRLYFDGNLVPMRSEREAGILKLLSEAKVEVPGSEPIGLHSQMAVGSDDIRDFFERTPDENCRAFIRNILESVRSEGYLRFTTDQERAAAKALADEANRDVWERPSGKKKRRNWRR